MDIKVSNYTIHTDSVKNIWITKEGKGESKDGKEIDTTVWWIRRRFQWIWGGAEMKAPEGENKENVQELLTKIICYTVLMKNLLSITKAGREIKYESI